MGGGCLGSNRSRQLNQTKNLAEDLFAMLGEVLFPDDDSSPEQLFGHLAEAEFTAAEAADVEVSIPTFRHYVQGGKLRPTHRVGRNQMFATRDLKAFKRSLRDVKREQ